MAAQKSTQPYSEPWADELRAVLQTRANDVELYGREKARRASEAVAQLDEFIAGALEVLEIHSDMHIDTGDDYPRLRVGGKLLYNYWYMYSVDGDVAVDVPLSLHFSPAVALAFHDDDDPFQALMRRIASLDDAAIDEIVHTYWIGHIEPTTQRISPGRRYVQCATTGALVEIALSREIDIAPLQ